MFTGPFGENWEDYFCYIFAVLLLESNSRELILFYFRSLRDSVLVQIQQLGYQPLIPRLDGSPQVFHLT